MELREQTAFIYYIYSLSVCILECAVDEFNLLLAMALILNNLLQSMLQKIRWLLTYIGGLHT